MSAIPCWSVFISHWTFFFRPRRFTERPSMNLTITAALFTGRPFSSVTSTWSLVIGTSSASSGATSAAVPANSALLVHMLLVYSFIGGHRHLVGREGAGSGCVRRHREAGTPSGGLRLR